MKSRLILNSVAKSVYKTIDVIHKWPPIHYSFVLMQIDLYPRCRVLNFCSEVRLVRLICTIAEQK